MKKLTTKDILKRFVDKYGDTYDYSLIDYKGMDIKVNIVCRKHGIFSQTPHNHLKFGCKLCGIEKQVSKRTGTFESFIKQSQCIHKNKYDYSLVKYRTAKVPVEIVCPEHGSFWQTPDAHLSGSGCNKCGHLIGAQKAIGTRIKNHTTPILSLQTFKNICSTFFGNKYDYSLIDEKSWNGLNTKVKIICPIHGVFEQRAKNHRFGNGCKKCNQSKGERVIKHFLDGTGVKYETEYTFKDCIDRSELPFDFVIFNSDGTIRCLIEYQGQQHFKVATFWGKTEVDLKEQQRRDQIKRDYCLNHNLCLLEVSYNQDLNQFFEEAGGLLWK